MAEKLETIEANKEKSGEIVEKPAQGDAPEAAQQVRISLDDSTVTAAYSNFCRVTGTPEEVIIDFALNPIRLVVRTKT